jgi:hypothetical protein
MRNPYERSYLFVDDNDGSSFCFRCKTCFKYIYAGDIWAFALLYYYHVSLDHDLTDQYPGASRQASSQVLQNCASGRLPTDTLLLYGGVGLGTLVFA